MHAIPAGDTNLLATHAKLAALSGLVVVPCKGKRPRVSGSASARRPPTPRTIDAWAIKWPTADWGFNPGASSIVIVDWDDEDLGRAIQTFGETPLHRNNTSGLASLLQARRRASVAQLALYRSACRHQVGTSLRRRMGQPPSRDRFRISNSAGTLADLEHLPPFNVKALERLLKHSASAVEEVRTPGGSLNAIGQRDHALFDHLRSLAQVRGC